MKPDLTIIDEDTLALVCGGDGDDPHGEEGTAGGSRFDLDAFMMRDLPCGAVASVVGESAATAGLLVAAMIGGPLGVVLAPVLAGVTAYAAANTTRDAYMNSGGGTPSDGMSSVTAP